MRGLSLILLCATTTLSNPAPAPPQVEEEYYVDKWGPAVQSPQGRFLYPFGPYVLSPLGQGLLGLGALGVLLNSNKKADKKTEPIEAVVDPTDLPDVINPEGRSLAVNAEGRFLYPFGPYVLSPLGQGLLGLGLLGAVLNKRKAANKPVEDVIATEAEAAINPEGRFLYPFGPYVLSPAGAGLAALGLGLALVPSEPKEPEAVVRGRDLLNAIAYDDLELEQEFALEEEFYRNLESFEDDFTLEGEERSLDLVESEEDRALEFYELPAEIKTILEQETDNAERNLDTYVDENLDSFINTGRALDFVAPDELDAIIDREVDAAVAAGRDLDRNGDGMIDRNEFHWTFPRLDLYQEFGRFDVDNSGFIEQDEVETDDESREYGRRYKGWALNVYDSSNPNGGCQYTSSGVVC